MYVTSNSDYMPLLLGIPRAQSSLSTSLLISNIAGIAQCLLCLWTQITQKKMVDCSLRKNLGRLKVDCSLNISYSKKSQRNKTMRGNKMPRHLPRVGQTRLSTSLSSLRGLTEQTSGKGPPVGTHLAKYQRGPASRLVRSSDFVGGRGHHCNGNVTFL